MDDNEDPDHELLVHGHVHSDYEQKPSEDRAAAGGWYRDEYQIYYRPTDHQDRFMKGWLDFGRQMSDSISTAVFSRLKVEKGPGMCVKCHSIDESENQITINWQAKKPRQHRKNFVRFSHVAHINLVGGKGCVTCHAIDREVDYISAFEDMNLQMFQGNFKDINKSTCADCHTEGKTNQDCLTCHNYHVGDFVPDYSDISNP